MCGQSLPSPDVLTYIFCFYHLGVDVGKLLLILLVKNSQMVVTFGLPRDLSVMLHHDQ